MLTAATIPVVPGTREGMVGGGGREGGHPERHSRVPKSTQEQMPAFRASRPTAVLRRWHVSGRHANKLLRGGRAPFADDGR